MAILRKMIWTLAITAATAFTTTPSNLKHQHWLTRPLYAKEGGGGGPAIAKPGTKIETKTVTKQETKTTSKQKAKPADPISRKDHEFKEAPMFRLYLIGDEEYDQEHVINRMTTVVEDLSEDDAASLFKTAFQIGEAYLGKYPKEIAELYAEQLNRSDPIIYADVREDDVKQK